MTEILGNVSLKHVTTKSYHDIPDMVDPFPDILPSPCDTIYGISQNPTTSSECPYIEEKCQTPHPAVTWTAYTIFETVNPGICRIRADIHRTPYADT